MLGGGCKCVVPGCNNAGRHLLPKDNEQRSIWIKAMKLEGQTLKISYPAVCSLHFKDSDYVDFDTGEIQMRRRYLKRHAVPSIFPWNEPPTKKTCTYVPVNVNSLSDTESEKENLDPKDPLTGSTEDEISIGTENIGIQSSENPSLSSDMEEYESVLCLNASSVTKTYSNLNAPIQFVADLPYLMTGTATDDTIQDPLCLEDSNARQVPLEEGDCLTGCNLDVANYIEISEDVEVKHEEIDCLTGCNLDVANYIETSEDVEVKHEEIDIDDNLQNSAASEVKSCVTCGQIPFFSVHNYKNQPNGIHFYTGLENFDKLMCVFHSLGNAVNSLNYFYGTPPYHLDALEQFFMTLLILRRHREFEDIAMTYNTTTKQVTNIFITWIRFMAIQWRTIDLWIDRDTVTYYMPLDFHDKYPKTRVIIDATECPIKKPHLPTTQQITFSSYKNRNTIKLLIGMAPSGLITYVSPCYGGSASDRQIIERSSILDKFDYNDEIMVDKGLNVQDIFLSYGVKINMPTFFKKGNQINPDTLSRDRNIASKRVHVERIIGMLKTYKILTQAMNQTETLLASDITFVIAMLVNFRSNIMNKNA